MLVPVAGGWRCAVCGAAVPVGTAFGWRCPAADSSRHHVLELLDAGPAVEAVDDPNPFVAYRRALAWDAFAAALGIDDDAREGIVRTVDAQVSAVAGTGFVISPFARADALSDALGFSAEGGVWVKDETHQVAGSHKARHLFTILLHLLTVERAGVAPWGSPAQRPPLAIASCGNAALAASTLAASVEWPIRVFVPVDANPRVVARLHELRADVVECPRLPTDPPGDPCVLRFREAVAGGAAPFSVQGPENGWCLDGGRTIGWEMAGTPLDRVFVQVGGGAFAACVSRGLRAAATPVRLHAVQTEACAPLARAWELSSSFAGEAGSHWSECMWPWESVGSSAADGILDDETYDWLPVVDAMRATGGSPVVVTESLVREANSIGRDMTGIDASATGTAGLAGLLAARPTIAPHERIATIFSGLHR